MHNNQQRRAFLQKAVGSIGLLVSSAAIAQLVTACETDETQPTPPGGTTFTLDISKIPALASVGSISAQLISGLNNNNLVFVSRIEPNVFVVFTTICTHAGTQMTIPESPADNIVCPLHAAEYNRSGKVVAQPFSGGTATDLPRFASTYDASTQLLTITP